MKCSLNFLRVCPHFGVVPTRFMIIVSIAKQTVSLFEKLSLSPRLCGGKHKLIKTFRCSTSRFGIGQTSGSNCTPLGLHRIAEKIGGGWPVGTVFRGRKAVGFT